LSEISSTVRMASDGMDIGSPLGRCDGKGDSEIRGLID
jgi:hypothetical protein